MKITSNKPDENQSYKNNFKENGVYPFSKITRVVTDKNTGAIFERLNENNSEFSLNLNKSIFDYKKHDIMCLYPKFYYRRNWEEEELEDCITTDIPPEHINLIPESISDKSFEVFPCFVREDGSIRDYVLYSAFEGSIVDGQLRSIPNEEVVVDKTLGELRGFARSDRDEKFNLENMSVIAMIQFLYKIGFQDLNSQEVLGKGWVKKQSKTKTGGTLKLGNKSGYQDPFANSPDKPDDRISLSFRAGENGELAMYNATSSDPMPIKTRNMAGLQKWEETDDYIIYLDKNAVMTTVANYVTGTYDLFKERKVDIDGATDLLKMNGIEWTSEDDSKLILDINKAQLERIANTPTTMEDEDFAPQTFTTRAVPTTYEACFRVDKKSGEIYIGEGYENISAGFNLFISSDRGTIKTYDGFYNYTFESRTQENRFSDFNLASYKLFLPNTVYSVILECNETEVGLAGGGVFVESYSKFLKKHAFSLLTKAVPESYFKYINGANYWKFSFKCQITKTSTPKPFVKSIMPSGKLAFVTSAHWDTHSFLIKKFRGFGKNSSGNCRILNTNKGGVTITDVIPLFVNNKTAVAFVSNTQRVLVDEDYVKYDNNNAGSAVKNTFSLTEQSSKLHPESFEQLLIYKGNLTEAELKAENEKDIIADNQIDNNEYPPQYNSNSLFGIENFYGNVKRIVDGFIAKDDGYYHTTHPNKMGKTSAYEKLPCQVITGGSKGVKGWSKKIDKNLGVFNIPSELNDQKDVVSVVTRGLIEWFDFADGKGTETTLKSRVSNKVLTLSGFNFDVNSGWTGKGLRFDGVDDLCQGDSALPNNENKIFTIFLHFEKCDTFYFNSTGYTDGVNWWNKEDRPGFSEGAYRGARQFTKPHDENLSVLAMRGTITDSETGTFKVEWITENGVFHQSTGFTRGLQSGFVKLLRKQTVYSYFGYIESLTDEEIKQQFEYMRSIDRTTVTTYPLLQEQKSYGIGLTNQLSDEQKSTFRLSVDGTKFVAGLIYCEGLEVVQYTYSQIQVEMEKEEWTIKEEEFEVDTATIEQDTKTQLSTEENRLTSKSNTKTSEETHYTDYFISHAPNKENIAIFGSDFEAEEKSGVFTLDLNKEIDHKDDRTSARLVILP